MKVGFLGDLHLSDPASQANRYKLRAAIDNKPDLLIQIGDFSEDPLDYAELRDTDPERVKILGGNHEHWPELLSLPHCLAPAGCYETEEGVRIFYLRGAYSIDSSRRKKGTWWPAHEQLHFEELYKAYLLYQKKLPHILVAHEASTEARQVLNLRGLRLDVPFDIASPTQQTLDKMIEFNRPLLAVNGHWHLQASKKKNGTRFRSLAPGEYREYDTSEFA